MHFRSVVKKKNLIVSRSRNTSLLACERRSWDCRWKIAVSDFKVPRRAAPASTSIALFFLPRSLSPWKWVAWEIGKPRVAILPAKRIKERFSRLFLIDFLAIVVDVFSSIFFHGWQHSFADSRVGLFLASTTSISDKRPLNGHCLRLNHESWKRKLRTSIDVRTR